VQVRVLCALPGCLGRVPESAVFPKLSKLLYQEDAWAPPAYAVNSALCRCAITGAGMPRKDVLLRFDATLWFATPKSSS
jgi:hypothetical protein